MQEDHPADEMAFTAIFHYFYFAVKINLGMTQQYFLQMIQQLRGNGEVMLYESLLSWEESEELAVIDFLCREYHEESLSYPENAPEFNSEGALWAAKTVYFTAQLILYRNHKEVDLAALFPEFQGAADASAILSADLCLRFLPDLLFQLKAIDTQDGLIALLEKIAYDWHYSAIRYDLELHRLVFEHITDDSCLLQLYAERVIEYKKLKLAEHPACHDRVKACLGMYGEELWKEFTLVKNYESN